MDPHPARLLCVDLQVDTSLGLEPDAQAVFCARQLLSLGRRLGWNIAHARRRSSGARGDGEMTDGRIGAMRPLMTEPVFFRSNRSVAESPGLLDLLDTWRGETVLLAAFDHVALLSCLLACYERGPRLVLVEDVLSPGALADTTSLDAFRMAARRLAAGAATLADITAEAGRHPPPQHVQAAIGQGQRNIPA